MFRRFKNRHHAGQELAEKLAGFAALPDAIVIALPRGGVPVAYEVARKLHLPLDILVVRKLGVPGHEELAFGAIASGGGRYLNADLVRSLRMTSAMIDGVTERETKELIRRQHVYRGDRPPLSVTGKTVILVDDGLATGATMRAAVAALKKQGPLQIVVAVPVASSETCSDIGSEADTWCVSALMPEPFYAVGLWYEDFSQTTDDEVRYLLARSDLGEVAVNSSA